MTEYTGHDRRKVTPTANRRHVWDKGGDCKVCGFDAAEWRHWKINTPEGRASTEHMPFCTMGASRVR